LLCSNIETWRSNSEIYFSLCKLKALAILTAVQFIVANKLAELGIDASIKLALLLQVSAPTLSPLLRSNKHGDKIPRYRECNQQSNILPFKIQLTNPGEQMSTHLTYRRFLTRSQISLPKQKD
jgi:hypothetical protein